MLDMNSLLTECSLAGLTSEVQSWSVIVDLASMVHWHIMYAESMLCGVCVGV